MSVFGCGDVIHPRSRSTADNCNLSQSMFPNPWVIPSNVMALNATAAAVLVEHPLRPVVTVHPEFLRCQEPIAQIPNRHATGVSECRPLNSSRLQIVPLVGILRHRRFRIVPRFEVVEHSLKLPIPLPCGVRKQRRISIRLVWYPVGHVRSRGCKKWGTRQSL